ncbi:MAG: XdhC family protein [Gemmatimonadetes bacterium]|nr:XdhC family protein [Gemmatimonadota bacterium]NNM04090.1 XdhC family protein [Gemmatimonadota bacterium]
MTNEDREIFEGILRAKAEGRPCALATVVATRGSTPRKNGAKMLIDPSEGLIGTVGGGCGEAEVITAAENTLETGKPMIVEVDLTDDPLSWTGSVCGGLLQVFVEPIQPKDHDSAGE